MTVTFIDYSERKKTSHLVEGMAWHFLFLVTVILTGKPYQVQIAKYGCYKLSLRCQILVCKCFVAYLRALEKLLADYLYISGPFLAPSPRHSQISQDYLHEVKLRVKESCGLKPHAD